MNHSAVVPCLMHSGPSLFFDDDHSPSWVPADELASRGEPKDPGADDGDVVARFRGW